MFLYHVFLNFSKFLSNTFERIQYLSVCFSNYIVGFSTEILKKLKRQSTSFKLSNSDNKLGYMLSVSIKQL